MFGQSCSNQLVSSIDLVRYPRGLAVISKDRRPRIKAIAEHIVSTNYDIVCLQELWVHKDFEIVREEVHDALPFSRFFHTSVQPSFHAIGSD